MLRSRAARSVWLLAGLVAWTTPAVAGERPFSVRPPGRWVHLLEVDSRHAARPDGPPIRYRLRDRQILVAPGTEEAYSRVAWTVASTAGLQDASEVTIDFSPSFERLSIHEVHVLRDGAEVWRFSPAEVRISQTQDDLESRLYDDTLTATIFVAGLRVGDTVDYSFSLEGTNPVLGGRFDTTLWFQYGTATDRVHRRLVWRRQGSPRMKSRGPAHAPSVSTGGGETTYEWDARDVPAGPEEDRTPSWFEPRARVEVSDFQGWADVARRSRELFASLDEPAPAIDAAVRAWRDLPEAERLERAVRFVQDEVRYLGLEMGPHSHQPHRPLETLERRYGDCKDKTALLVALLRRLGVRAWPALVSTEDLQSLDERLPSLFAFDHVIVALQAGGGLRFVDATASQQGGRVATRRPPPFARALVLDQAADGLTAIPEPALQEPTTTVSETFVVGEGKPARLEVVTTYRDDDADEVRGRQARATTAETARRYRDFYTREYGDARGVGTPSFEDDRERNVIVTRESYELPHFADRDYHDFRAWLVDNHLTRPKTLERVTPLAIPHPTSLRHTLLIRLPDEPDVESRHETVKSPAFSVEVDWRVRGSEARLDYTYRSLGGTVEPAAVRELLKRIDQASDLMVCRVASRQPEAGLASVGRLAVGRPPRTPAWVGGLVAGGFGLAFAAWVVRSAVAGRRLRQRRSAFRSRLTTRAGEQPATAIVVDSEAALGASALGGACACGGGWQEVDRAALTYDGERLCVLTRRCDRCAAESTVYLRVAGGCPGR